MAGTLEVPVEGNANTTEDPKVKAGIKRLNELLEGSNLIGEAGIGAAQVSAAKLATGAKELFPQLAVAAARKINFGSTEVEWGGAINSKTTEVTHSLGTTPVAVLLTPVYVEATRRMFPQVVSTSSTKIGLNSNCADAVPGAGVKQTIYWLAIG